MARNTVELKAARAAMETAGIAFNQAEEQANYLAQLARVTREQGEAIDPRNPGAGVCGRQGILLRAEKLAKSAALAATAKNAALLALDTATAHVDELENALWADNALPAATGASERVRTQPQEIGRTQANSTISNADSATATAPAGSAEERSVSTEETHRATAQPQLKYVIDNLHTAYQNDYRTKHGSGFWKKIKEFFRNKEREAEIQFLKNFSEVDGCTDAMRLQAMKLVHDKITETEFFGCPTWFGRGSLLRDKLSTEMNKYTLQVDIEFSITGFCKRHRDELHIPGKLDSYLNTHVKSLQV